MSSSPQMNPDRARAWASNTFNKIERAFPDYIFNGIVSGIVGAFAAGLPSTLMMAFRHTTWSGLFRDYVLYSLQATGNFIFGHHQHSKELLIGAGLLANFGVSIGAAILLAYAVRGMRSTTAIIAQCVAMAVVLHYANMVMLPKTIHAPLWHDLASRTGSFPFILDNIAHGAAVGATLAWLKNRRLGRGLSGSAASAASAATGLFSNVANTVTGAASSLREAASTTTPPSSTTTTTTTSGIPSTSGKQDTFTGVTNKDKVYKSPAEDPNLVAAATTTHDKKRF